MMQIEEKNQRILEFLNTKKFSRSDVKLMGNALSTIVYNINPQSIKFKSAVHFLLSVIMNTNQSFEQKGDGKVLTCFTHSYGTRKDYEKDMRKVLGIIGNYIASFPLFKKRFVLKRFIYAFLIISWLRSMRGLKERFSYKLYCCAHMLRGYIYRKELTKHLDRNEIIPKVVVTLCDVHVCDYFVTSYFNKMGICTVTLQHAEFDHIEAAYLNSFSISKYFLGISENGKHEYIESGKDGANYVVLGSLKYIGQKLNEALIFNNTGIFGIALSGVEFQNQNKTLIEYASRLAKDYNYKVLVRCHPALNSKEYEKLIDSSCMEIDRSESLENFANKCDFCIMGRTNTFSGLITNGHLAIRMICDADIFSGISYFKFQSYEELKNEVLTIRTDFKKVEEQFYYVRKIVCAPGDIEDNYRNFFNRLTQMTNK